MTNEETRTVVERTATEIAPAFALWFRDFMQNKDSVSEKPTGFTDWMEQQGDEAFDNGGIRMRKLINMMFSEDSELPGNGYLEIEFDLTIRVHERPRMLSKCAICRCTLMPGRRDMLVNEDFNGDAVFVCKSCFDYNSEKLDEVTQVCTKRWEFLRSTAPVGDASDG